MQWRDEYTENKFQTEMHKLRRHINELFANTLPEPRTIEDATGKGDGKLLSTPTWPGGPAWKDIPGIARTDLPISEGDANNKARVLDF